MNYRRMMLVVASLTASAVAWAQENIDGKSTYEVFQCGLCHGDDARTPKKAGAPNIAGLDSRYVADKTGQMVENIAHKDVLGTCGEQPTKAQIQAIAEWVSRQPK